MCKRTRRGFLLLAASTLVAPRPAMTENARIQSIGVLAGFSEDDREAQLRLNALYAALEKLGWKKDRNVRFEYRWQVTDVDRLRSYAEELVKQKPDLLLAVSSTVAAMALKRATGSIPILFINLSDLVGSGVISSLAHPNGNLTGFTNFEYAIAGKWLSLLKECTPQIRRAALLFNPRSTPHAQSYMDVLTDAAKTLQVGFEKAAVNSQSDLDGSIKELALDHSAGLIVANDTFNGVNRRTIISLCQQLKLPAVYPFRFFAADGRLLSYGADPVDIHKRAAGYVARILNGERPDQLPVQQPERFELVINMRTAKSMGLTLPAALLARADEVLD
jgi:ABC-type uncharacterized transport system substrate-binding protein